MVAQSIFIIILMFTQVLWAGEVVNVCKSQLPIVELDFRQGYSNFAKIKTTKLDAKPISKFLTEFYSDKSYPQSEKEMMDWALLANEKLIPASDYKIKFLKYATTQQRLKDSAGYRDTLIQLMKELIPTSKFNWYLTLKDTQIVSTEIVPATGEELNEVYGAVARLLPVSAGKFNSQIVVSNNDSEPVPYMLTLLVHELQHASTYKERIKRHGNEKELSEFAIVDEAKAFDLQMATYIDLAKKYPELFCNWIYLTWAYGDLPIPLAWAMASLEKELGSGKYIYNYAKMGSYKDAKYLLNTSGDDLRDDIKKQIKELKLKFVK